jgi:hypothetical protein
MNVENYFKFPSLQSSFMLKIRAHHLLCIPRHCTSGYNRVYTNNLNRVCSEIRKNPGMDIMLLKECDVVCSKCPHKKGGICEKRPKINYWILVQDGKVLKELRLKKDSIHKARDIFNLSMDVIGSEKIAKICRGCEFLEECIHLGINSSFRKDLNTPK